MTGNYNNDDVMNMKWGSELRVPENLGKTPTNLAWGKSRAQPLRATSHYYDNLASLIVMLKSCACAWGKGDGHDFDL